LTVTPIYQRAEVAGALAMAADRHCSPLRDPIPLPAPDVFKKATRGKNETAVIQTSRRVVLSLAQFNVVLLIMLAFLYSQLGSHRPALTAVKAAPLVPKIAVDDSPTRDHVGQAQSPLATGSEDPRTDLPVLEPSHLRVTDTAASSLVEGLSRYEMHTVRRQAQYGDDVAALTLGMAYEIGRHVPQSCTQAGHWVAVAAEEGNSAAQYNLALRYVSGDGTPTNLDEARKWLEEAAGHGYQKAQLTLQASRL
jgi:TPR repeat protein